MKAIFTLLFFVMLSSVHAQFPNLVDTDMDGVEHNLQEDYLDQGKPVLIHFFAAWNPWDQYFLDTNSMQTVYDIFGPDGTDQVMMLAYEMDSSTTDQMLEGNTSDFEYNFVEAYNFPIINSDNPDYASIMNLNAMPAIIVICPDGTIYTDGSSVNGPSNYPSTPVESLFYSNLLETNGVTNAFELTCGINLADETISGHITMDDSGGCVQDFDNPIPGAIVTFFDGTNTEVRSSNAAGYYEALLVDGTYDITYDAESSLISICDEPGTITIAGNIVSDVDATFQVDIACPEIILDVEPWLIRPCDRISYMTTSVCNRGTVDASIFTLNIQFPPGSDLLTVNTSDIYNYDMATGVFSMACDSLAVFTCKDLNFSFHTPCESEVGDTLCFGMETEAIQILPICTDYIETNIEDCSEVIGSYDPNDKQGLTQSTGEEHFIEAGTTLEYMIRFQNTGNDTAFTVRIEDQLGAEFIAESIRPIASSHDYSMVMKDGMATFLFENILLVDSFKNEPASHGFITFTVETRGDAEPGTEIDNTASIFFDSNDPIITNTFTYTTNLPSSTNELNLMDFVITPNPASSFIHIEELSSLSSDALVRIVDINGRDCIKQKIDNEMIDVSALANGTYFIQLFDNDRVASITKKIVILK